MRATVSAVVLALMVPSAASALPTTLASSASSTNVVAYGCWAAWSTYDAVTARYALTLRSPTGAIGSAGVAERSRAFDVSLGPAPDGGVLAGYSRCADSTLRSCRLVEVELGKNPLVERTLAVPGGGSLYSPAVWENRVAFLRVHPHGGSLRPQDIFEWVQGSRHLLSFSLPRNEYDPSSLGGDPELKATEGETGQITWLALHGSEIAYTRVADEVNPVSTSDLWLQRPGQRARVLARWGTGGQDGERTFLSPTFSGDWLYTYAQLADQGDYYVRYSLSDSRYARSSPRALSRRSLRRSFFAGFCTGAFAIASQRCRRC